MAGLVVAQMLIFTEVLATAALFGLAFLALLRLWRTAVVAIAGLALGALVAAPFLYVAFAHPNPLQQGTGPLRYPMDLANLWTPTRITAYGSARAAGDAARMVGGLTEQTGYFGAGLLTLVIVFAVVFRGTRAGWALPSLSPACSCAPSAGTSRCTATSAGAARGCSSPSCRCCTSRCRPGSRCTRGWRWR